MDTLILYYSRTDTTAKLVEGIGQAIGAEIVKLDDGVSYKGLFGFIRAARRSMGKNPAFVKRPETKKRLFVYKQVIIAAPIWAETWCCVAARFLEQYGKELPKKVHFVFTHMADNSYEKVAADMDKYLESPHSELLSVSTKKGGYEQQLMEFLEQMK